MGWNKSNKTSQESGWAKSRRIVADSLTQIISTVQEVVAGGVIRAFKSAFTDHSTNGFWLGVDGDGVAKISIGDNTAYLRWDGTQLLVSGEVQASTVTGTVAVDGGAITWGNGKGRADDTGLEHVEGIGDYWEVKPTEQVFMKIISDSLEIDHRALHIEVQRGVALHAQNTGAGGGAINAFSQSNADTIHANNTGTGSAIEGSSSGISSSVVGTNSSTGSGIYGQSFSGYGVHGKAPLASSLAALAADGNTAANIPAILILDGHIDTGSQRITNLANATTDTDALNRQTGDGRYLKLDASNSPLTGHLDFGGNNITNLADITFKTGAAGGTLRTGTSAADKFTLQAYDVNGGAYTTLMEADAGNDPTLQIFDETTFLEDRTDPTKRMRFQTSGITTGATRTLTVPDASGTISLTSDLTSYLKLDASNGPVTGAITFQRTVSLIGTTDEVKQIVRGAASQTANLTEWQNSAGTVLSVVDKSGNVGIGTTAPGQKLNIKENNTTSEASQIRLDNSGTLGNSVALDFFTSSTISTTSLRTGRICGVWDGGSYANSRLTMQSMTSGDVLVDTLTLKNGNVGIGTTAPTAALHLKAGTATANTAPLKLTSGINLATPETGAFEFDGTSLYFTVGGVRKTVTLT